MLYYLLYSLSFVVVWMLLFLDLRKPGLFGACICLLYTFYSSYYIQRFVKEETKLLKYIKLTGPLFYLIAAIFMSFSAYFIIDPIVVGFLIFTIHYFDKNKFPKVSLQVLLWIIAMGYSFFLYDIWLKSRFITDMPNYNFQLAEDPKEEKQPDFVNIAQARFLNTASDTITVGNKNGKYIILEAWNETYVASLRSIPAMQPFYEKIAGKADYYYVYMPIQKKRKIDSTKVFAFDKIKNKEKILFDIDLWDKAAIDRLPTYFVFDAKGKLVFRQDGYGAEMRLVIQNKIRKAIQ